MVGLKVKKDVLCSFWLLFKATPIRGLKVSNKDEIVASSSQEEEEQLGRSKDS
jgi:hypothetical protein